MLQKKHRLGTVSKTILQVLNSFGHVYDPLIAKKNSLNTLPDELIIEDKNITKSENIAIELNKYFTSISQG